MFSKAARMIALLCVAVLLAATMPSHAQNGRNSGYYQVQGQSDPAREQGWRGQDRRGAKGQDFRRQPAWQGQDRRAAPPAVQARGKKGDERRGLPPAADRKRAPSQLYPDDDRRRSTLQQMMRHDRARSAVESGTIKPLHEIRGQVRQQFKGRIVGVELHEKRAGGRPDYVYDVRVLTQDGDVLAVEMDARSGQVRSVKGRR